MRSNLPSLSSQPDDDDDDTPSSSSSSSSNTRTVPNGATPAPSQSPVAGVVAATAGSAARLVDGATAAGAAAAAKLESFRLPELDEDQVRVAEGWGREKEALSTLTLSLYITLFFFHSLFFITLFFFSHSFSQFDMLKDIADPATFGRRGEWLVVLQFTALFFVLFPPHAVSVAVQLAGLAGAAGGLLLAAGGATALGPRSLSPFPTPRSTNVLTTTGAFGVVRHPMYAGLLALAAGLTAVSVNPGRLLATACLALVLREKVRVEEGALAAVHGAAYEAYRERVKAALIPLVW